MASLIRHALLITHDAVQCGVARYSKELIEEFSKSKEWTMSQLSLPPINIDFDSFKKTVDIFSPDVLIFNYPAELRQWLPKENPGWKFPRLLIENDDCTQEAADSRVRGIFSDFAFFNTSIICWNPCIHTLGRMIPPTPDIEISKYHIPIIGTYGFATSVKRLDWFCKEVRENFKEAVVRIHMPGNDVMDPRGEKAKEVFKYVKENLPWHFGTVFSDEYLSREEMIKWLRNNSLNVFFYDPSQKGTSGALDLAIAAGRPIALNKVQPFAHLFDRKPSPFVEDYYPPAGEGLKKILENGDDFLDLRQSWTPERFLKYWEILLDNLVA